MKHRPTGALAVWLCVSAVLVGCALIQHRSAEPDLPEAGTLREPEREFRAAWAWALAKIRE